METPEQYTVKTPEQAAHEYVETHHDSEVRRMYGHHYRSFLDGTKFSAKQNSELIKENERLREENKLYREALTKVQKDINWMCNSEKLLSRFVFEYIDEAVAKFQPKKDERTNG